MSLLELLCRFVMRTETALMLGLMLVAGCGSSDAPPKANKSDTPVAQGGPDVTPENSQPENSSPEPTKPDPEKIWAKLADQIKSQLAEDDLDAAEKSIAAIQQVYGETGPTDEKQQEELAGFQTGLTERVRVAAHRFREERLQAGRKLMDLGKFDESLQAIEVALARSPSDAQREQAGQLKREIEYRRKVQRSLGALRKLLGSELRSEVQSAQIQLWKEPDTAMPLLVEWAEAAVNPRLVANALDTMRRIKRPQIALPAMFGVLSSVERKQNWNDAVKAISGTGSPGIGPNLLILAVTSKLPEQRIVAFTALSQVPDVPGDTLVRVLPFLFQDGPELTSALRAAYRAVVVNRQHDLPARRGIETDLTPGQQQQLSALGSRLADLIKLQAGPAADAAYAAKILAIATRQLPAEPLPGVKVDSAVAESETGKKEAVVDGVWNSVEPGTMWYHPVARKGSIILDLGEEKTVVGVRIWNFNQPGGMHRGWKEIDVYVSNIKSELTPTTSGIGPPAPGIADPPDYSTTIPVDFVRGRYVKLKAKSVWRSDGHMGLSEIQVLGF